MNTIARKRRVVAVLASFILNLFTLFGPSSAAMTTTGNPMKDITNTPGTINVYEYANPGGTLEHNNGNKVSAGGEALGGVPFTLYKMEGVDLASGNAGWGIAGKIADLTKPVKPVLDNQNLSTKVTIDGKKYTLEKIDEKTTVDGTGLAQFTDMYPGLYIVVELKVSFPPGSIIVIKMAPFFITLPIKNAKDAWSYTADVYPKNTVSSEPERSTEVKNTADGVIIWTVKQTLPTFDDTNKLTKFRFKDDPSGADDTKGTLTSVKVTVNREDKTGNFNKGLAGLDDKHLVITAKNSGDLPSGGEIIATYTTKVSGNSQLRNDVLGFISDVEAGHTFVFTDLGKITVRKLDTTDKTFYLSGAKFKVCVDEGGVEETKDCPTIGTVTTEKSLGMGPLDKLRVQRYVLFETTVPAGYTFNPDAPYKANLTTATYDTVMLTVENTKTNMPTPLLTDAGGQLLVTIGGVAFVLLAGGVLLAACKKCSGK